MEGNQTKQDATPFSDVLEGVTIHDARCVGVYDGDSITVHMAIPFFEKKVLYEFKCRLSGIDTAEMRGTSGAEKEKAVLARDVLRGWILDKEVVCHCHDLDKYGRLLIEVHLPGEEISCNARLIEEGLALPYDGGTKASHKCL